MGSEARITPFVVVAVRIPDSAQCLSRWQIPVDRQPAHSVDQAQQFRPTVAAGLVRWESGAQRMPVCRVTAGHPLDVFSATTTRGKKDVGIGLDLGVERQNAIFIGDQPAALEAASGEWEWRLPPRRR